MLKQLSAETAMKLAQQLGIPIEQLVHTPRHIVLQKLAQLTQEEQKVEEVEQQQEANKELD